MAAKRPVDELRSIAAPHDLIEWVRKLPVESAARTAWVDATRADWMPYLALLRGIGRDAILRAACECATDLAGTLDGDEARRTLAVLADAAARGKDAFATTEADLSDLRLAIIAHGQQTQPVPRPPWMFWTELVLELARAANRGNPLVGIVLAMRMLATRGKRPSHTDLVARFRDKLTLAG